MTIRVRIAVALVVALTPVLALGVLETFRGFRYDAAVRETQLVQAAQRSAIAARAQVAAAQTLLESVTPQTVGFECAPRLAALADRLKGYTNLVRLDAQGRVQCAARSVYDAPEQRRAHDWFRRLQAGDHFVISRSTRQAEPNIVAALRVEGPGGAFAGATVAVLPLASLKPDTRDPSLPRSTEVALVDREGGVLMQTGSEPVAAPPGGWRAAGASERVFHIRPPGGGERTQVVSPLLEDGSVKVVLSAPQPGVVSWARLNPLTVLVLPLLAWLLAWAVVWIVTERVVIRWLEYLDRIAAIYARGRFSVRPVQAVRAPAEIRALARTLDAMADAIVTRDLAAREHLAQKDALMREIHHRVKNNLQVITSLLNMQQRALTDPVARAAMYDTRQRIAALALIYRALYQNPDLRRVDVRQFLEELIGQLVQGEGAAGRSGPVRTDLVADDLEIDPDKLAPLALFAVEALTQARKAAAAGGGAIHIRFLVDAAEVTLEIADDNAADPHGDPGDVGRTLMTAYARQLRGRSEIVPSPSGGRVVRLVFPSPESGAGPSEASRADVSEPGRSVSVSSAA